MIDWVSIVRHSRRRFSDYMFAVPAKIRKRRRAKRHANSTPNNRGANNAISRNFENGRAVCECCWNHKTRFDGTGVEEQLPPPPSPPQLKETAQLDGVPRLNSVDRILHPDGIPHIGPETLNKSHDSWQGHDSDQDREESCRDHRDQTECTNLYKKQKRTKHRPQHTC